MNGKCGFIFDFCVKELYDLCVKDIAQAMLKLMIETLIYTITLPHTSSLG